MHSFEELKLYDNAYYRLSEHGTNSYLYQCLKLISISIKLEDDYLRSTILVFKCSFFMESIINQRINGLGKSICHNVEYLSYKSTTVKVM